MKLSSHRDLLLVIISSLAVLIISWLQLVKGNALTFIEYISILLLPGYSIITAIWPSEDKMEWSLRAGVGFVLGLFFVLFLPLILESLKMGSYNENILLILAVLFSLIAMARRKDPIPEEPHHDGKQLTLDESVERAAELREKVLNEDDYHEYYDEEIETPEEEIPEGDYDDETHEDERQGSIPLTVDEEVTADTYPTEYEEEMDKPIWMDEDVYEKSGFSGWYSFLIKIFLVILLMGVFFFVLDFLGWDTGFLKEISRFSMELIVLSTIILVAMILLPRLLASEEDVHSEDEKVPDDEILEEVPDRMTSSEKIPDKLVTSEEVHWEKEEKYFVPLGEFSKQIKGLFESESRTEKILSIILIISIILAISTTVYIIVKPKQGEKFTEFYILGPGGNASDYPTSLTNGQKGEVIMGVVNHEYATTDYKILVKVKNHTLHNQTLTLKNGEKKEIPFNFTAGNSGNKKMQFLLYKLPDQKTAYRSLHLWLNITT
ncbi:MAG: DUF1616 domain-containing protein [Methanobacterium sp.]|jgi:uncharacterized membrane protein